MMLPSAMICHTSQPPQLLISDVPHSPSPSQKAPAARDAELHWAVLELILDGHSLALMVRRQRSLPPPLTAQ